MSLGDEIFWYLFFYISVSHFMNFTFCFQNSYKLVPVYYNVYRLNTNLLNKDIGNFYSEEAL